MWGYTGMGIGAGMPNRFEEQYHCYSVAYADKSHLEVSEGWYLRYRRKNDFHGYN